MIRFAFIGWVTRVTFLTIFLRYMFNRVLNFLRKKFIRFVIVLIDTLYSKKPFVCEMG